MNRLAAVQHRAFSLIEVLVALAIFALAVGVFTQTILNSMTALEYVKGDAHKDQLYRFAIRQILKISDREEMEDGGSIETPEDGPIDWSAEIEDTEVLDLFQLNLELTLADEENSIYEREAGHLESIYVFRPGWAEAVDRDSLKSDKEDALRNQRLNPR